MLSRDYKEKVRIPNLYLTILSIFHIILNLHQTILIISQKQAYIAIQYDTISPCMGG